ncbi:NUDIX hydrolase [Pseudaestuariivita sp.]|uniref:NUDIX hydrolase n=1 Tax=Pseudaestuariivita sp. TaxID=2211669 RepID=UPI004059B9E1
MQPWETLDEEEVFAARPFLRVVRQRVRLPDGAEIDDFYQVKLRSFGMVIPVQEDGRVRMLEQYKHGPGRAGLSFPAGFIDPGEAPDVGAARELMEETGLAPDRLIKLGCYVDNGNQRGCEGHYFLGLGCREVAAPDDGDLEEMRQVVLTVAEVDAALKAGQFNVSHDVAGWGQARVLYPEVFGA